MHVHSHIHQFIHIAATSFISSIYSDSVNDAAAAPRLAMATPNPTRSTHSLPAEPRPRHAGIHSFLSPLVSTRSDRSHPPSSAIPLPFSNPTPLDPFVAILLMLSTRLRFANDRPRLELLILHSLSDTTLSVKVRSSTTIPTHATTYSVQRSSFNGPPHSSRRTAD